MSDPVEAILRERVIAILRRVPDVDRVVDGLAAGGVRVLEITLDDPHALQYIARLARREDLVVGAGTVRTVAEADAAIAAGAAFCVSPATVPAVVERCLERGVPPLPGALTPTELERARALGAPLVKLFPASLGGPGYLRDILAPLGDLRVVPTGGIDAGNARAFLDAGARAVGAGGSLVRSADVEAAARELVRAVQGS